MALETPAQKGLGRALAKRLKQTHVAATPEQIIADQRAEIERLTRLLAAAEGRIADLESECDGWATKAGVYRQVAGMGAGDEKTPRLVNQYQAARLLGVKQYQISRWLAAGHFVTEPVEGRAKPLIVAASLHIPARKRKSQRS